VVIGDYQNRVFSDDERSDHGVAVGYRKPPTPQPQIVQVQPQAQSQAQSQAQTQTQSQQPPQFQQKSSGGTDLPSPDSVSRFVFSSFQFAIIVLSRFDTCGL
jgi:hypothetical protein